MPLTCRQTGSQHPDQRSDGISLSARVRSDRSGIAASHQARRRDQVFFGRRRPADLATAGARSTKIRSDGDQILKPVVGIFPQIPYKNLPWRWRGFQRKPNLIDESKV
jgi:hypothetical protein